MDPIVLSAVIAAIASVITGVASVLIGRTSNKEPTRIKLYREQLTNFFEPMDKLLSFSIYSSQKEMLSDICQLVDSQYRYVPPSILKEVKRLRNLESVSQDDFGQIHLMVASFYNWLKKHIGLPYEKASIKTEFTPQKDGKELSSYTAFAVLLATLSGMFAGVVFITHVLNLLNDRYQITIQQLFYAVFILIIPFWLWKLFDKFIDWLFKSE